MEESKEKEASNSIYGETVVTSKDQLLLLPDNILSEYHKYLNEELPRITKEELTRQFELWFSKKNGAIHECTDTATPSDDRLSKCDDDKRRRIDSHF